MKNEKNIHTLAKLANLAKQTLNQAKNGGNDRTGDIFHQDQVTTARHVSSILSGLYRQKSESEWEWLKINRPEWWAERIRLENELDGHFMAGDSEAGQETFFRLVDHLKNAPIDELSSRIARQLDGADPKRPEIPYKAWKPRKLPGHPEPWDGTRISGQEYYNLPPVKKQQNKK